jgi:hypothetical protein
LGAGFALLTGIDGLNHGAVPSLALGMHALRLDAVSQDGRAQVFTLFNGQRWQRIARDHQRGRQANLNGFSGGR